MKSITNCTRLLTVLVGIVGLFVATSASAQSVSTDKADYVPGEVVIVSGSGWQAGETVTKLVTSSDPLLQPDFYLISVAGEDGSFTNNQCLLGGFDEGLSFTLAATGESSGSTAQTAFTDVGGPPSSVCGNNIVETGEQCDDGNTVSGDGCSATCHTEQPATCSTGSPPPVQSISAGNIPAGGANFSNFTCQDNEWHWIINQVETGACPVSINVTFSPAVVVVVPFAFQAGGACHYIVPDNSTGTVLSASASIYGNWSTGGICGNGQFVLSHVPCNQVVPPDETSTITTDIHFAGTHALTGPTVTMGASVHDSALVVTTNNTAIPGGTVTFNRYASADCGVALGDLPVNACTVNLVPVNSSGGTADETTGLNPVGTCADFGLLSVGQMISYNASYSGDTIYPVAGPSPCEKLEVKSSITSYSYTMPGDTNNTGTYTCTLESKCPVTSTLISPSDGSPYCKDLTTLLKVPFGPCPTDTSEACIVAGTGGKNPVPNPKTFKIHVDVTNDTGGTITEFVQGGLAANATYNPVAGVLFESDDYTNPPVGTDGGDVTCGDAKIDLSKSNSKTGNVVTWSANGSGPSSNGFTMLWTSPDGTVCDLSVQETKNYTGTGEQPVTSPWSETQVPGGKSPYAGQLAVCVVSNLTQCATLCP